MKQILIPLLMICMAFVNASLTPMVTLPDKQEMHIAVDAPAMVQSPVQAYLAYEANLLSPDILLAESQTFCDRWSDITEISLVAYNDKKFDPGQCLALDGYNYKKELTLKSPE